VKLHEQHTQSREKVECFACHGDVQHGPSRGTNVAAMLECQTCHSDTHNVQRTIYGSPEGTAAAAEQHMLGPMFLTHVECKGCHVEKTQVKTGTINSFGMVAKATPQACDRCHEAGTGEKYVGNWQKQTKGLYESVNAAAEKLQQQSVAETDKERAQKLAEKARQARGILNDVVADGSWGVHNFKYTEAMLLQAKRIIAEDK
jgi:hypothetical protein